MTNEKNFDWKSKIALAISGGLLSVALLNGFGQAGVQLNLTEPHLP